MFFSRYYDIIPDIAERFVLDGDKDLIKDASTYRLNLKKENGKYKIEYSTNDDNGSLNIESDGDTFEEVLESLYDKLEEAILDQEDEENDDDAEQVAELKEQLRKMSAKYEDELTRNRILEDEINNLREKVEELEEENEELKAENEQLNDRLADSAIDRSRAISRIDDFLNELFA